MSLNSTTADALAVSICTALGVVDTAAINKWKTICEQIYLHLKSDAVVNVASVSGVTTGAGVSGSGTGTLS
jgi:hypothetical protein